MGSELTQAAIKASVIGMVVSETWSVERVGDVVTARFTGRLTAEEGMRSAKEFAQAIGTDSVRVIFDIREMSGYESAARKAWISKLQPVRRQLEDIRLQGGNAMVRMGGSVMGAMLGVPIRSID